MQIKTNNVPRDLISGSELPPGIMESEFDYVPEDDRYSPRFFQYRGAWYDAHEFVTIGKRSDLRQSFRHDVDDDSPLLAWDGIQTDTYFSGILIRWTDHDCERVVVGRCYS